jgi:hypothetical protein
MRSIFDETFLKFHEEEIKDSNVNARDFFWIDQNIFNIKIDLMYYSLTKCFGASDFLCSKYLI